MTDKKKIPKKQKLRNAEYYDMQSVFDKLYADSKKGIKFTELVEIIKSPENIKLAYRNMRKNKGSKTAGTDKKTISDLNKWKEEKLISHVQRKLDWYIPQKVRRIEIPKENGKIVIRLSRQFSPMNQTINNIKNGTNESVKIISKDEKRIKALK